MMEQMQNNVEKINHKLAVNSLPWPNQLGTMYSGSDRYAFLVLQTQGEYIIGMVLYDYENIPDEYIEKTEEGRWLLNTDKMRVSGKPLIISETNIYIYKQHKNGYWYKISSRDNSSVDFVRGAELYQS